jgi:hypothetical protein
MDTVTKPSKRTLKALKLYEEWRIARVQYISHRRIVNSPLPPHKQKLHNNIFSQCLVRFRNTASAFENIYEKLNMKEKIDLDHLVAKSKVKL